MANTLLTISMITREALRLFRNSNSLVKNINKEYRSEFGKTGWKIGDTLQIRKPLDYTVRQTATASPQNSIEQEITLTVNNYFGVDSQFTSQDLALSLDVFSDRVLAPMANNLGGGVASNIMGIVENGGVGGVGGICNVVNNTAGGINDGADATISPTANTWLNAGAYLDINSAPQDGRIVIMSPFTQANTVSSLSGLFNPQRKISDQFEKGMMGVDTLGYDKWFSDQTVITHTTAAYSTLADVNGANQTGTTLTVHALAGPLSVGDFIQITGVNAVNRVTKQDTGILQTFVVTAAAATSATSISIYPPITPPSGGVAVQYQTVTASPADSAPLLAPIAASQVYRKNFVMHPSAMTAVFVELPVGMPGTFSHRENFDGMGLRMTNYYAGTTDTASWRLDCLFGTLLVRPEWAVCVTDHT